MTLNNNCFAIILYISGVVQLLRRLPAHLLEGPGGSERVRQAGQGVLWEDPTYECGGYGSQAPDGVQQRQHHRHWIQSALQV